MGRKPSCSSFSYPYALHREEVVCVLSGKYQLGALKKERKHHILVLSFLLKSQQTLRRSVHCTLSSVFLQPLFVFKERTNEQRPVQCCIHAKTRYSPTCNPKDLTFKSTKYNESKLTNVY